jgi:hypothetical protein
MQKLTEVKNHCVFFTVPRVDFVLKSEIPLFLHGVLPAFYGTQKDATRGIEIDRSQA